MRKIKKNGDSPGLWTRRRPADKPGVAWVSETGDATFTLSDFGEGLFSPSRPGVLQMTARVQAESCEVWYVLFLAVGETELFDAGTTWRDLGGIAIAKLRGCDGDVFHVDVVDGSGTPLHLDVTLTPMVWTDLGSFDVIVGDGIHLLCTIGKATSGSPESEVPFWFIPPPNTAFPTGYFPTRTWLPGDPSPVNWAGGIALALTINPSFPNPPAFANLVGPPGPGDFHYGSFCALESQDEAVFAGATVHLNTFLGATWISVPSTVVAGVPFDFQVQLDSPMDTGDPAADFETPLSGVLQGLSGFVYGSGVSTPGTVTNLGGGLYQFTGFTIFRAGVQRIKVASAHGFNLRCSTTIEVTPAAPAHLAPIVAPAPRDFCSGELVTGDNAVHPSSPLLKPWRGRFHVQGIDPATPTVTDKNGNTFAQVGNYTPITIATLDAFQNICDNDNTSTITASLVDFSGIPGGIIPFSLSGTLTQTVVNGLATFPDLRGHGIGFDMSLQFNGPSGSVINRSLSLQPLLRVRASVTPPSSTIPVEQGVVTVTLTDIDGNVLNPSPADPITLSAGPLGGGAFTALGTSSTPVAGVAGFTGTFPSGTHGTFNFYAQGDESNYDDAGALSNRVTF